MKKYIGSYRKRVLFYYRGIDKNKLESYLEKNEKNETFQELFFTFNEIHYHLSPEIIGFRDEQLFVAYLYGFIKDLYELGGIQFKCIAMVD